MPKFKTQFTHKVEITYEVTLEAKNEKDALKKLKGNPFDYDVEQIDEQGISLRVDFDSLEQIGD